MKGYQDISKGTVGTEEIAQRLGALIALAEDLGLTATPARWFTSTPVPGDPMPSSGM